MDRHESDDRLTVTPNDQKAAASAGVNFPPPLIFAIFLATGWLANRQWRWAMTAGPESWRSITAVALIAIAVLLMSSAVFSFRRARTSIIPNRPVSAFVVAGPYRFTRNPMYVSMAILYSGIALLLNSWWPFVLLLVVLVIIRHAVIAREERYLRTLFPVEYPAYCARVRRWV